MTSVVNFLVSDANLNSEHIILLESAPSYLTKCINGDGNITGDLDLDISALKNIKKLEDAYVKLGTAKEQLDEIFKQKYAYNNYSNNYNNIIIYKIDNFSLISYSKTIKISDVFNKIHKKKPTDTWSISCGGPNFHDCDTLRISGDNSNYCIEPKSCDSTSVYNNWYTDSDNSLLVDYAKILDGFINSIKKLKNTESETNSIKKALESLNTNYDDFLQEETKSLEIYKNTIGSLVNIFIDVVGEDKDISGIINCKFIGSNIKVVLKFLNKSLGKNIYTVGIYLLVVGLAI